MAVEELDRVTDADRRTGPPSTSEATGHGRQPEAGYAPAGADAGDGYDE